MSPLQRYRKQISSESRRLQVELARQSASLDERRELVDRLISVRQEYVPARTESLSAAQAVRRMQFVQQVDRTVAAERETLQRLDHNLGRLREAFGRSRRREDGVDAVIAERAREHALQERRRDQRMTDEIAQIGHRLRGSQPNV